MKRPVKPNPIETKKEEHKYCEYAEHDCDKRDRWNRADAFCPRTCCRRCADTKCENRCLPPNEFHVKEFTLKRSEGWNKLPEEQPAFSLWRDVDVIIENDGKAEMIIGEWQADTRKFRHRETEYKAKILAWKDRGPS